MCKHMLIRGNRVKMGCSVIKNLVAETGLLSKYTHMQLWIQVEYWRKAYRMNKMSAMLKLEKKGEC